jgi:hypothetical protein
VKSPQVFVCVILLTGCATTYKETPVAPATTRLNSSGAVLVSRSENGSYQGKTYAQSGQMTAEAVRAAFVRHTSTVKIASDCTDIACLRTHASDDIAYLVVPEILHWEDRATEWSGIKDKLSIKIAVFARGDQQPISSIVIDGKSKWMTFGGDHPQDMLAAPIERFVNTLY